MGAAAKGTLHPPSNGQTSATSECQSSPEPVQYVEPSPAYGQHTSATASGMPSAAGRMTISRPNRAARAGRAEDAAAGSAELGGTEAASRLTLVERVVEL